MIWRSTSKWKKMKTKNKGCFSSTKTQMNQKIVKNWDKFWRRNSKIKKISFKTIMTTLQRFRARALITLNSPQRRKQKQKIWKLKENISFYKKKKTMFKINYKNYEIETSLTRRRRIIEINKNFVIKVLKLKRQRSTIDLKSTNFNIYNDKNFKKFKNWTRNVFNVFEINFFCFFLKRIKIN